MALCWLEASTNSYIYIYIYIYAVIYIYIYIYSYIFTIVSSGISLNVLDLTLFLVDGFIQTDIYSKPTDHHIYLLHNSAHPSHCTKAIPFGVATRVRRNCSTLEKFEERSKEYQNYLVDRGYHPSKVKKQFDKAKATPREDLLTPKIRERKVIFPLVVIVTNTNKFDHITPVLRELQWPSVKRQLEVRDVTLLYKIINGLAPAYLANKIRKRSDLHNYSTKHKDQLHSPFCRTTTAQRSFFYRSINIWNSLSYSTNSESLSNFKNNIKRELFNM